MPETLVNPAWLADHLDASDVVVVDCRFSLADAAAGSRAYAAGHIPGAVYADLERDLSSPVQPHTGRHPLPNPRVLGRRLGEWGIDGATQVVVYDDAGGAMAARLWWLARWLGHSRIALLDGGIDAWQAAGGPVETSRAAPRPRRFEAHPDEALWVSTGALVDALGHHPPLLLDARAAERFAGLQEPVDPVAGHVPGALNRPFADNLDERGRFRSADALRTAFARLLAGRDPADVVHMCGSGVTACHNLLAMEVAGLPGSRLYAGSWSEWIRDGARPVALG